MVSLPSQQRINHLFHGVWEARLCYACGDFVRAIAAAEAVLALHPLDYPGSLAWKWKGLAHLARGEKDAGQAALQEGMRFHAPDYFRDSPNVRLIMQTARIALLEWCLHTGNACPDGVPFHVSELCASLAAFPEAQPYFCMRCGRSRTGRQDTRRLWHACTQVCGRWQRKSSTDLAPWSGVGRRMT